MSSREPLVGIVDYEAGNLYNVAHALNSLRVRSRFSACVSELLECDRIILPGVGAAAPAMRSLREQGLAEFLRDTDRPLLGICLGMQLMFDRSAEDGTSCLGRLSGDVVRFSRAGLKVPHMGWNQVGWTADCALAEELDRNEFFYFVHSYYVRPDDSGQECGNTDYGIRFTAAVHHENLWGVQFHPERSGPPGLQLLSNFIEWKTP